MDSSYGSSTAGRAGKSMPRVSIQEEQNAAPSMMEAVQCNYSATKVTSLSPSSGTKSCVSQHSLGLKAGGLETKGRRPCS